MIAMRLRLEFSKSMISSQCEEFLNLSFFVIPTGLSHLPYQSKGHGVWLWASGNVVGYFSQILLGALDERMYM
jgi:hypothetical protein